MVPTGERISRGGLGSARRLGQASENQRVEAASVRRRAVVAAVRWCAASVVWALLVGATSVAAGLAAGSTALVGFGLDSLVDGGASATLVWRFTHERRGTRSAELLERRAARIVGGILLVIGVYLVARATVALAEASGPESSPLGMTLTAASVLVLPVLASAKLRLAVALRSRALRADGVLSGAGAALAAAALLGLALSTGIDWWWGDAVAALFIAAALLREGVGTLRPPSRKSES
jgi:divalent metal cation (Fe/Co/Zn/Cd) transporter